MSPRPLVFATLLTATSAMAASDHFEPRQNFGARLEPKDTVLHGAGQSPGHGYSDKGFLGYCEAMGPGLQPALYMTYIGFSQTPKQFLAWGRDLKAKLEFAGGPDLMPQIGLALTSGKEGGTGATAAIARGDYDAHIAAFIKAMKIVNRPSYVRIGYEFEGSWNNYEPKAYVAVFKRITTAMREADLNVATVWCAAGGSAGTPNVEALMPYYPGDEWVDWWSIDTFSTEELTAPLLGEFCQEAGRRQKPVMIGEATPRYVGVLDGEQSWEKWFEPYFAMIRRHPQIKASSYINWEWDYWSEAIGIPWENWGDARIQMNDVVLKRMRREMASPLYQHAQLRD